VTVTLGVLASVMTAELLIIVSGVAAPSSRHGATNASRGSPRMAVQAAGTCLADVPSPTGTLSLGGVSAGLDHAGVRADLLEPGGHVRADLDVGLEPGKGVDGLVGPLVRG